MSKSKRRGMTTPKKLIVWDIGHEKYVWVTVYTSFGMMHVQEAAYRAARQAGKVNSDTVQLQLDAMTMRDRLLTGR